MDATLRVVGVEADVSMKEGGIVRASHASDLRCICTAGEYG
jgi:hypothetical protein